MSINSRVENIVERFNQYDDWEDRYRELIKIGKALPAMEESYQVDKYKIKGCQSQVWLKPGFSDGIVTFYADSDAVLVKGIIGILVDVYSGSSPKEIIATTPDFLKKIGITDHLSMNRTNGLASMVKQIQMYALVFDSLVSKGVMSADNL